MTAKKHTNPRGYWGNDTMTANTGGKGHMDGKSLFEKVQTMLQEGTPTSLSPAKVQAPDPAPESLAFNLNANRPLEGQTPLKEGSIPSGAKVSFQSPLFGDLQGIVIEDRGAVVWVWHPLRECECCIPRGWITGWGEDR